MAVDLQNLSRRPFMTSEHLWTNAALRPHQCDRPILTLIAPRQMEAKGATCG